MGVIKYWVLISFALGLLVIASALSFLAVGILAISGIIVELGAALYPDRKSGK